MQSKRSVAASLIASAALAAFTLGVFAKSQLRGPEGTVNRYFEAILKRDYRAAGQLCVGTNEQFFYMTRDFLRLFSLGAHYQIIDVVRDGASARTGVVFSSPQFVRVFGKDSREIPTIVFLRRVDKTWLIDAGRTLQPYRLPD